MSKFSLNSLAAKFASKSGISQTEAELFIRKMFEVCNQGLETDKQVKMRWLGTFKVTAVKDRESVDVNTGERILIEGRDKISFTPDNILKEIVNKPFAQFETVVVNDDVDFDSIDEKYQMKEVEASSIETSNEEKASMPISSEAEASASMSSEKEASVPMSSEAEVSSQVSSVDEKKGDVIDFLDTPQKDDSGDEVVVVESHGSVESFEIVRAEQQPIAADTLQPESAQPESAQSESAQPESVQPKSASVEEETFVEEEVEDEKTASIDEKAASIDEAAAEEVSASEATSIDETTTATTAEAAETETTATTTEASTTAPTTATVATSEASEAVNHKGHFVLPKYVVISACVVFLAMMGGVGWLAFNYGQMAAQRNHLAMQLDEYKAEKTAAKKAADSKALADAQEQSLKQKAYEDSVRMAQASDAIKVAEAAAKKDSVTKAKVEAEKTAKLEYAKNNIAKNENAKIENAKNEKAKEDAKKKLLEREKANAQNAQATSKYDSDPRVRTGAYRIVGVAQTITVSAGQSMSAISNRYLGPGMECYIEALNGTATVKSGQKIKIPKLELKKRKK